MKISNHLKYLFLFVISLPVYAAGQQSGGLTITGQILDAKNQPVSNAQVKLYSGNQLLRDAKVSSKGQFTLSLPMNHQYNIFFSKEGYTSKKLDISTLVPPKYDNRQYNSHLTVRLGQSAEVQVNKPIGLIYIKEGELVYDESLTLAYKTELLDSIRELRKKMDQEVPEKIQNIRMDTVLEGQKKEAKAPSEEELASDTSTTETEVDVFKSEEEKEYQARKQEEEEKARQRKAEKQEVKEQMQEDLIEASRSPEEKEVDRQKMEKRMESDSSTQEKQQEYVQKEKQKEKREKENKATKNEQTEEIVETYAKARIEAQKKEKKAKTSKPNDDTTGTPSSPQSTASVQVSIQKEEYYYKTVRKIIIQYPAQTDTLQEIKYWWGTTAYYKNDKELTQTEFFEELNQYDVGKISRTEN